ncbi:MAG TPA: alpha-amylase family glycosyl hydrolase, partial [Polyangiaceae bacterium]|nr:alpha-amylase family glycosyl hydrolase [Polyangiaceae bacterium]
MPHEAFSSDGDLLVVDAYAAHALAAGTAATPAEVTALALLHELLHVVISRHAAARDAMIAHVLGACPAETRAAAEAYVEAFPPPEVFSGDRTAREFLDDRGLAWACEEMLLLWVSAQNPAYACVEVLASPAALPPAFHVFADHAQAAFARAPSTLGPSESLLESLLGPARSARTVFEQLAWLEARWGLFLTQTGRMRRVLFGQDLGREEARALSLRADAGRDAHDAHHDGGPLVGLGGHDGAARFTPDRAWMPETVVVAKNALVWLAQLSARHARPIETLADIPDEALRDLADHGVTTLWLIGLWERSDASRAIKVARGDAEAAASPYAIFDYRIADSLGGERALDALRERAGRHGLRLGADMVPNHMGLTSRWVLDHPERFLGLARPPFPTYRFDGPDLSPDPRVSIRLERGYEDRSDAAVVFERRELATGQATYIYHGNDGTGLPWNDTAQLDYSQAAVREAVIECILHVCRMFPVVRFDAAMTLAKRHVQRLWFPAPGAGGDVPSRAEHALTGAEFDRLCPTEFWRDVVDRVTRELPDTLLVAEAFWMMEGTFVRDFGMHRVYDSAFMHMLRAEQNASFFAMLAEALAHEPEVLGRFVHFLSNPDEEPARVAFGAGDKYFGACAMMCTLPGLPLFSHGQLEGLTEKYGMEFRAPRWDEAIDEAVVARHRAAIAPLLRARALFAGVEHFELFVVEHEAGGVAHDVFAYANERDGRRALFVFHNGHGEVDVVLRR